MFAAALLALSVLDPAKTVLNGTSGGACGRGVALVGPLGYRSGAS